MAKKPDNQTDSEHEPGQPKKPKAKPGRKRMGQDVFVPVTMKLEPSELATIEMIAQASGRSRSDVMREMLSYGLKQMMQAAFGPAKPQAGEATDTAEPEPKPSRRRTVVSCAMDSDALAVLEAMAGDERGARSGTMRRAIAEGLAIAEGGADD